MTLWIDAVGTVVEDHQPYVAADGTTYTAQFPKSEIPGLQQVVSTDRPTTDPTGYTMDGQARGGVTVDRAADGREWEVVEGVQVWRTTPRPAMSTEEQAAVNARDLHLAAEAQLAASDKVATRCVKASVPYPADWLARDATLRAIAGGKAPGPLPARPNYPAGT